MHPLQKSRLGSPFGPFPEQLGAAPFIIGRSGLINRIVEPQRHFHCIGIDHQRCRLVELIETVPDMVQGVVMAMRFAIEFNQLGRDRFRQSGCTVQTTRPQRREAGFFCYRTGAERGGVGGMAGSLDHRKSLQKRG